MATAFSEDDYDDYTGRIGPDGEPERYSTMLGGDPRLAQQRELASRAQRLAEPIIIDNWLKSITKDARGTEAASQVTLTPGVEYRIRDFTGRNDGQIIASGSTPEELLRLQDAAQALARQGTRADYRLEQVGGPAVAGFQTYTDPDTGKTVQVIGGDLYNKPIASTIAEIGIPIALAVAGGAFLAPLIAPGAAAGSAAAAGGLAAGTGIGSFAGNVLVGKPLDQALISGLTTAATAGGGSFLGPQIGPIVGSSAVGTGIGAGIGNFAANVATGTSLEDALKSAGISGLTAGTLEALFPNGLFNNNPNPTPTGTNTVSVPGTTNVGAGIGGSTSGFDDAIINVLANRGVGSAFTGSLGGAGASNISLRDSGNDFDQQYETWRNSLTARQLGGRDIYNAFMDGYPEGYQLNSTGQLSDVNYNIYPTNATPGSEASLKLAAFLRDNNILPGTPAAYNYFKTIDPSFATSPIDPNVGYNFNPNLNSGINVSNAAGGAGGLTAAQIAAAAAAAAGSNTGTGTTVATTTGATGNDTITSSTGNDTITGGTTVNTNTLTGGARNDTIPGGTTVSTTTGGARNDTIPGGTTVRTDTLTGGKGNDTITGGTTVRTDTLTGGTRNETITGGTTVITHTLTGGTGNDTIPGGATVRTDTNPRRTITTPLNNLNPGSTVRGETTRTRLVINPLTGEYVATEQLNPAGQTVRGSTDEKTRLYFPNSDWLNSYLEQLKTEPPGPTTKQKIFSVLKTIAGLSPLLGLIPAGDGGGGTLDPGPGLPPGGTGGIGRIRNPATFDPFTYGQREGEFDFFRNAPATTGTVTGIGGTGTTTGTTGTTTTGTRTTGTPGPAATAAEVQAAYPGYTNIRQDAQGRWFGEPIPGYTASGTPATGLRVTAGGTFDPTVADYGLFNPGFESIERNADGRYSGARTIDVVGSPGMTLAQVQAQYGATHRNITQDASGNFFGTRDVTTRSAAAPTTLEQVRALNLGYDDYELDNGNFSGIRRVTTNTPRPATLAEVQAQFGSTYNNITQNPDGRFFGQRTVQTSGMPTLEQIRNLGLGYENYEQDGTDFYGIRTGPDTVVPGTRKTLEQIRGENPDYDDYGTNEGGDYFGIKYVNEGPAMAEGGEVDDDMVRHLIEYRKGGGHMGPGQVKGIGSGQEDKIPAWLSDGEYVWSAQDVADLGDGSTDEGVRRLDRMRKMVRQRAGRKDVKKIAKPQRGIEDMLKAVGGAV